MFLEKMEKIFNFEDRLVRFAGECIFFTRQLDKLFENEYYKNQLIRSSGSASLNFGEAQGTITDKDFVFKVSLVVIELKESRNSLKILDYINHSRSNKYLNVQSNSINLGFNFFTKFFSLRSSLSRLIISLAYLLASFL